MIERLSRVSHRPEPKEEPKPAPFKATPVPLAVSDTTRWREMQLRDAGRAEKIGIDAQRLLVRDWQARGVECGAAAERIGSSLRCNRARQHDRADAGVDAGHASAAVCTRRGGQCDAATLSPCAEGEWAIGSDGQMKRHGTGTYKSGDNTYEVRTGLLLPCACAAGQLSRPMARRGRGRTTRWTAKASSRSPAAPCTR